MLRYIRNVPGMVAQTCNPSTWEVEAGGLWGWGQPGLYSDILSLKKEKRKEEKKRNITQNKIIKEEFISQFHIAIMKFQRELTYKKKGLCMSVF
jgi:hypothetical protein